MTKKSDLEEHLDALVIFKDLMLVGDVDHQANLNLVCVNVIDSGDASQDRNYLHHVVVYLRKLFEKKLFEGGRANFYSWYDAQAGQLRFSAISAEICSLPFKCKYSVTNNEFEVIEDALSEVSSLGRLGVLVVYVKLI